ncbi:MAG: hypothetical protein RR817_10800 [Niameybacter sp.]|uniref:hypothetical protein n=1 Tax=Niameybacter sp. TaxID=2033640 RepID=UPI002FC7B8D4
MSAPLKLTVAPRFIEGTLYVPVEYFSLFAHLSEQTGTLTFNLRWCIPLALL